MSFPRFGIGVSKEERQKWDAKVRQFGKKGEQMWKMLDEMQENDPEGYKTFIENTMKEAKESNANLEQKKKTFTPTAGFVIKTVTTSTGYSPVRKVFINVCSHKGVSRPLDAKGDELPETAPTVYARQIPLLVGPLRTLANPKNPKIAYDYIDVVFSPWTVLHCEREKQWKINVVELAITWVEQDVNLKLSRGWKCIKSVYKGGSGPNGNTPCPFPLELAQAQGKGSGDSAAKQKDDAVDERSRMPKLNDPQSLLQQIQTTKRQTEEDSTNTKLSEINITSTSSNSTNAKKKSLIVEVDKNGNEIKKKKVKKKKKKKTSGGLKAGFLNNPKASIGGSLYPEGSNEGAPKKTIYDKFNVVDTRTMSQDQINKAMEDYAGPGSSSKKPLTENTKEKKTATKSKKASSKTPSYDDALFDSLASEADPELGKIGQSAKQEEAQNEDVFGDMAQMVKALGYTTKGVPERKKNKPIPMSTDVEYKKSQKGQTITYVFHVDKLPPGKEADVLIDIKPESLHINFPPHTYNKETIIFETPINADKASAKFSQKKKTLKIKVPLH
eukprot:g869.t1